jgi:hypothetical protein
MTQHHDALRSRMPTTPPRPVVGFDPLDQAWRFEDRPLYQRIREAGGIAWSPEHGGFWAVVDQELGRQVIADHTRRCAGWGDSLGDDAGAVPARRRSPAPATGRWPR